jgi:hypothetical protein
MATIYTRASKGSALTWTEGDDNITNLNNDKIEAVIEDTAPELGGNLDVGDYAITTTSENGEVTIQADGVMLTAEYLGIGLGDSTAFITTEDNTSDLEINTNGDSNNSKIVLSAGANGDITLTPNGTGSVVLDGLSYPQTDGTAGQVLVTDGAGNLSFDDASGGIALTDLSVGTAGTASGDGSIAYDNTTGVFTYTPPVIPAAGISDVVADTTPQLGGNLDVNGNSIVSVSNGNIVLAPNGTGRTVVNAMNYNEGPVFEITATSGTIAPNVGNGNVQYIAIDGNITINGFTSPIAGQSLTLIVESTGARTLTSSMLFAGGDKTLTADGTDVITIYYTGLDYIASIGKDFK